MEEQEKIEKWLKELEEVKDQLGKADLNMTVSQAQAMHGLTDKKNWLENKIKEAQQNV